MRRVNWVVLILLAGTATVLRSPDLVFEAPRLWAEEGRVYLSDTLNHDPVRTALTPRLGYYSITANLSAAAAAHTVELEHAPVVTTWLALLLQLAPIVVIATSQARPFRTAPRKLLATVIVLSAAHGEIWLNTVNSQFFLAIAAALVLVETLDEGSSGGRCWGRRVLLLIAGLAGPLPAFLSPLWLLAALKSRSREAWVRVGIVALCSALQLSIAVSSIEAGAERSEERLHGVTVGTAGAVVTTRLLVEPLAGTTAANAVADALTGLESDGVLYHLLGGAILVISAGALLFAGRKTTTLLLPLAAMLVVGGSLIASRGAPEDLIRAGHNTRYVVFPIACLLMFIADRTLDARGWGRWIGAVIVTAAIIRSGAAFESGVPRNADWPDWRTEVARYREDRAHRPAIWPGDPWHVIVDKTKNRDAGVRVLGSPASPSGPFGARLGSTPARMGKSLVVTIDGAPAGATGLVGIDAGVLEESQAIPDLAGCSTWLPQGIGGMRTVPFRCDENGRWTYTMDLAVMAALAGDTYTIQARFQTPTQGVSNAVVLTIGF